MKLFKMQALLALALLCPGGVAQANWVTLDFPGATQTYAYGIDGDNIVGMYRDSSGNFYGFLHDGDSWTALDYPGASQTQAHGIDGDNIVGWYTDSSGRHGFLYDGDTMTALDYPGARATETVAYGIDGDNIVGGEWGDPIWWPDPFGYHYDGATWIPLRHSTATDVDGENIVCAAFDNQLGYLYDGTSYTPITPPGVAQSTPYGIDGDNIVGDFIDGSGYHGFLYDGAAWTTLDFPGGDAGTYAFGIDGDTIVGTYQDGSFGIHGFIYTIPEPATILLIGFGALGLVGRRRGGN